MSNSKKPTNRLQKNYSPINSQDGSARWQFASSLQDRLQRIYVYGDTDPRYVLRLASVSRTYLDLIRRYSNDTIL